MARKHLQEIYGEPEFTKPLEIEVTDDEVGNALTEIIAELKEKYGDQWSKHIGEVAAAEELAE